MLDKYKRAIVAVREDHSTTPPTNAIVAIDINSQKDFVLIEGTHSFKLLLLYIRRIYCNTLCRYNLFILFSGNDFYSSPRISPRGDKLA